MLVKLAATCRKNIRWKVTEALCLDDPDVWFGCLEDTFQTELQGVGALESSQDDDHSVWLEAVHAGSEQVVWTGTRDDVFTVTVADPMRAVWIDPVFDTLSRAEWSDVQLVAGEPPALLGSAAWVFANQPLALWMGAVDSQGNDLFLNGDKYKTLAEVGELVADGIVAQIPAVDGVRVNATLSDTDLGDLTLFPTTVVTAIEVTVYQEGQFFDVVAVASAFGSDGQRVLQTPVDWVLPDGWEIDEETAAAYLDEQYLRKDVVLANWQGEQMGPVDMSFVATFGDVSSLPATFSWQTGVPVPDTDTDTTPPPTEEEPDGIVEDERGCGCSTGGSSGGILTVLGALGFKVLRLVYTRVRSFRPWAR